MDNLFGLLLPTGVAGLVAALVTNMVNEWYKAGYLKDLERLRNELAIVNARSSRFYERQFLTYGEIWEKLLSVKLLADDLWVHRTEEKLASFAQGLFETKRLINKKSLFLEEHQYDQVKELLEKFTRYDNNQADLENFYTRDRVNDVVLEKYLERKEQLIQEYTELLEQVRISFRSQIQIR